MVEILDFQAPLTPLMYIEAYVESRLEVYPEIVNDNLSVHQIWKQLKYKFKNDIVYILTINDQFAGWMHLSKKGEDNWFDILIVRDKLGLGLGSKLLEYVQTHLDNLHAWVVPHNNYFLFNKEPYYSPLKFYEKCGFRVVGAPIEQQGVEVVEVVWEK